MKTSPLLLSQTINFQSLSKHKHFYGNCQTLHAFLLLGFDISRNFPFIFIISMSAILMAIVKEKIIHDTCENSKAGFIQDYCGKSGTTAGWFPSRKWRVGSALSATCSGGAERGWLIGNC